LGIGTGVARGAEGTAYGIFGGNLAPTRWDGDYLGSHMDQAAARNGWDSGWYDLASHYSEYGVYAAGLAGLRCPPGLLGRIGQARPPYVPSIGNGDDWWRISNVTRSRPGTLVPERFDIKVAGRSCSVHPNATKHMEEYARRTGFPPPISSFAGSIERAASGLTKGRNFVTVGNWELGIDTQGNVIYHALFRP
jgi:hypothetical protein